MKFKKIIIWLIVLILLLAEGKSVIKKYIYPQKYHSLVKQYSAQYDLDPYLVLAVIKTESNFNENVESNKGAKGLMQIMDSTGEWIASKLEVDNFKVEKFIENNSDRCYHCKKEVFKVVKEIAAKHNIKYVLDGTNLDDLSDFRPGLKALEELDIISPLKECGLTKDDIRQLSKDMELNTHNKPAFACLATRIPYGTKITKELLKKIEKSEEYLISVGFKQFRVRAHNDIARIEVGKDEIHKFFNEDLLNKTNKKLKEIGFKYVTLDMAGYEMGSMNK